MEFSKGVAILVPVSSSVPGLFVHSFGAAMSAVLGKGMAAKYYVSDAVPLDLARDILMKDALGAAPALSYMLWLDADILVEHGQVERMIEFMEKNPEADAASALYFRKSDFSPVCFLQDGKVEGKVKVFEPQGKEPQEIDACGMGCMIVRASSAAAKLAPQGSGRYFRFGEGGLSEDIGFCLAMKKAGLRLFLLPEVSVLHAGGAVGEWHHRKKGER